MTFVCMNGSTDEVVIRREAGRAFVNLACGLLEGPRGGPCTALPRHPTQCSTACAVFKETENALLKAIEDLRALDNTSGKPGLQPPRFHSC